MMGSTDIDYAFAQIISSGGPVWMMIVEGSGTLTVFCNACGGNTRHMTLEPNRWYDFRVDIDFEIGGPVAFYINGADVPQGTDQQHAGHHRPLGRRHLQPAPGTSKNRHAQRLHQQPERRRTLTASARAGTTGLVRPAVHLVQSCMADFEGYGPRLPATPTERRLIALLLVGILGLFAAEIAASPARAQVGWWRFSWAGRPCWWCTSWDTPWPRCRWAGASRRSRWGSGGSCGASPSRARWSG